MHPKYLQNPEDDRYDIALLKLNENIGDTLGWASISFIDEKQIFYEQFRVILSGYPAYKTLRSYFFYPEEKMFYMEGVITKFDEHKLYYRIDSSGGQSGSVLWRKTGEMVNLYGIHTQGISKEKGKGGMNSGIRITKEIIEFIKENK